MIPTLFIGTILIISFHSFHSLLMKKCVTMCGLLETVAKLKPIIDRDLSHKTSAKGSFKGGMW